MTPGPRSGPDAKNLHAPVRLSFIVVRFWRMEILTKEREPTALAVWFPFFVCGILFIANFS